MPPILSGVLCSIYGRYVRPASQTMLRNVGQDPDVEFPAMVMFHILIVFEVFLLAFLAVFLGLSDSFMDARTQMFFAPVLVGMFAAFGWALTTLVHGAFIIARRVTIWTVTTAILLSVALTGGFPSSTAAPALLIVPAAFYCLYGGRMGGLSAAAIVALASAQWLAVDAFGLELPDFTSQASMALNHAISLEATMGVLIFTFWAYDRETVRLRAQRDAERAHLAALVHQDPLTGIANARHLNDRLEQACARVDRHGGQLALLYLDFNGFKQINDEYGHLVGDLVLCKISHRLRQAIRREDIVARIGGDEFAILVEFVEDEEEVAQLTERVHHLIAEPVDIDGLQHKMTASVGRVLYPNEVADKSMIIEQADRAMYRAKRLARSPSRLLLEA